MIDGEDLDIAPYKGYRLGVTPLGDSKGWLGEVRCKDLILCQGSDLDALEEDFKASVDNYLEVCGVFGQDPEPPLEEGA